MSTTTRAWKVYGAPGHRQREAFSESRRYDFSSAEEGARVLTILNHDVTQTFDYSVIAITRNNADECAEELNGQLSDGIFENSRIGKVVEIESEITSKISPMLKACLIFAPTIRRLISE